MNIECKAGVTFLKIDVFGESQHLNPFRINTDHIRYIRKYDDAKGDGWAIMVGDKMYPTRDLNFDDIQPGDTVQMGSTIFECVITTSLTEKDNHKYKTLINYKNILYSRKFVKKDNKNDSKSENKSENLDKFALVTVDERMIPVINLESDDRTDTDRTGSSNAGAPVPAKNM